MNQTHIAILCADLGALSGRLWWWCGGGGGGGVAWSRVHQIDSTIACLSFPVGNIAGFMGR
ncbi:hypothetical protein J6590_012272, partial [Homalodisca vitripennis]